MTHYTREAINGCALKSSVALACSGVVLTLAGVGLRGIVDAVDGGSDSAVLYILASLLAVAAMAAVPVFLAALLAMATMGFLALHKAVVARSDGMVPLADRSDDGDLKDLV